MDHKKDMAPVTFFGSNFAAKIITKTVKAMFDPACHTTPCQTATPLIYVIGPDVLMLQFSRDKEAGSRPLGLAVWTGKWGFVLEHNWPTAILGCTKITKIHASA
jgi:hypothetical protein